MHRGSTGRAWAAVALLAPLAAGAAAAPRQRPASPTPLRQVSDSAPAWSERDHACRAALEQAYDGYTGAALARLQELEAAEPEDPLCAYVTLLVRVAELEQAPKDAAREGAFHARCEQVLAAARRRLARDPTDARARLAAGGALAVASRLHMVRFEKSQAARRAAEMRRELLQVPAQGPHGMEALFGLGLYDYYVDVLPRLLKLLRLLARLPGGDRQRGLEAIERAERRAWLHHTEVQVQLAEIYVWYEDRPDEAHGRLADLRERYPHSPLWSLRLIEVERERLGLFAESARHARELLAAVSAGRANHAPVVGLLARAALGEALLADLRLDEAREAFETVRRTAPPGTAALAPRAHWGLGRCLELQGQRTDALAHYARAAETGLDGGEWAKRAAEALEQPLPRGFVRAAPFLAQGRRLRETGHVAASTAAYRQAWAVWPDSAEARLRLAEDDLAAGRATSARLRLEGLRLDGPAPPWVRPWAALLRGRAADAEGRRVEAVQLYKEVFQRPLGSAALLQAARAGLEQPYRPPSPAAASPRPDNHSN